MSKSDVGTYLLKMSASDLSSDCFFNVNLIFKDATSTAKAVTAAASTTKTTNAATST